MTFDERAVALNHAIDEVIAPEAPRVDTDGCFPERSINALRDAGILTLTVPEADGGTGARLTEVSSVVSRIGEVCASTAMVLVMHYTALTAFIELTTGEQRRRLLGEIVRDRLLITEAISEPASGSQWWSVGSSAIPVANGYRLSANKSFATSAGHASYYVVSTRSPEGSSDRDHALFAVDARRGECETGIWNGLGLRGNSSTSFRFEGDVPDWARLDAIGENGLRRYNEINQPMYHLGFASVYLGVARSALASALKRVRSRTYREGANVHGPRLADLPIARRHVGQMQTRLLLLESLTLRFADEAESAGNLDEIGVQMTALKIAASELSVEIAHEAMKVSGGAAYSRGFLPIERALRDSLAASLMGPNDDFSKELIGRLLLDGGSYHDL